MNRLIEVMIIIILISFLSCTNESPLENTTNYSKNSELKTLAKKMVPATDVVLADNRFEASVFYDGINGVDGIVSLTNSKLLVVQEWGDPGQCVFRIKKGDTFDVNDAFSTIGDPLDSPDDIIRDSDGTVYVTDGNTVQTVFKISKHGGVPQPFITTSTTRSSFNPFGLAIAPANFDGPNVDPGDIIVADNAYSTAERAVWAVNPNTGVAKIIAEGTVFDDGPILVEFDSNGTLYVNENTYNTGSGRIVTVSANGTVTLFYGPIYVGPSFAINPKTDEIFFRKEDGKLHRMLNTGGAPQLFASNLGVFQDIAFNKNGTALYFGSRDKNQVVQISAELKAWK